MKTATLFSAVVFVGMVLLCVWLIPTWYQLHVYASGYDDSLVGSLSFSNDVQFEKVCSGQASAGNMRGSSGICGIHSGAIQKMPKAGRPGA